LRALDGITTTGAQWPARLLREAALLHLAREGWTRLATLPAETQADLRNTIGFTLSQEEVLAQAGVRDRWLVAGQRVEEEDRLRTQRTWLFGLATGRPALCLSFSATPSQPLDVSLVPGTVVEAELAFYPSAWPLRALVKQRYGAPELDQAALPHRSAAEAMAFASAAFTANPWLEQVPLGLSGVIPVRRGNEWLARDDAGDVLPLAVADAKGWTLLALSGGAAIGLAGEWNGDVLRPLSVWAEGRFLRL